MYFYELCSKMSQATQKIGVVYASGMCVACAVRFVSCVEQFPKKKFLDKTFSI